MDEHLDAPEMNDNRNDNDEKYQTTEKNSC